MTKETLKRAKELEYYIDSCKDILEYAESFQASFMDTGIFIEVPDELTTDIKILIRRKLEEYKQELDTL